MKAIKVLKTEVEEEERKINQCPVEMFEPIEGKCYTVIEAGKSCIVRKRISDHLQKQKPFLKEVHSVEDCDVILVFCPIVSRAGTDIDAALNELNAYSEFKPAIFMVLHYTFEHDKVIPDSSRYINRTNTFTVDCLFHEEGLLACDRNTEALTKIVHCFKYEEGCCEILWRHISGLWYSFCRLLGIKKAGERTRLINED
ncbi:uncharacterized protein LOC122345142 isoform X2 [Puntigrus tetrazona]|uniref:uncharacterized protein LOC122345142 isoform X2 n=1 Tax=Puntigrus tetrazona TaxID=1606681 RepID=UPI001C89EC07|nr:uncharacterized protein LOC122345142 isoform X2 [Puntigrus tetrazona]